jgi:hypothetical protein
VNKSTSRVQDVQTQVERNQRAKSETSAQVGVRKRKERVIGRYGVRPSLRKRMIRDVARLEEDSQKEPENNRDEIKTKIALHCARVVSYLIG